MCQQGLLCNAELTRLPVPEMSFPLSVRLLPEGLLLEARPTYRHERRGAGELVGDLWWIENELHAVTVSQAEDCT